MKASGHHSSVESQFTIWNIHGLGKIYSSYELANLLKFKFLEFPVPSSKKSS